MKKLKTKICKVCHSEFQSFSTTARVCSPRCAIEYNKQQDKKAFKAETRCLKEKLKSRSDWIKETQQSFNAYIRYRDKDLPCISCGRVHDGQYHAGHYKTTGSHPELRFHPMNCHKQCAPCNNHLSGNVIEYRKTLINRIGEKNVEWLERDHPLQKWNIEDLKEIKQHYKQQLKYLKDNPVNHWMEGLEDL